MASDPVHPDFDAAGADAVLRSAETACVGNSFTMQKPHLFKVRTDFLKLTSSIFRDMIATCGETKARTGQENYIQLQEGVFELRHLLLAHDDNIGRHPDLTDLSCPQLLALAEVAVKYNTTTWQKSLETAIEHVMAGFYEMELTDGSQVLRVAIR